jgi:hypothetical protein
LNWKSASCVVSSFSFTISFRQEFFHAALVFQV